MPFDSTAELLFKISADPSDATANIQRFRTLFGKSLDDIRAEAGDWAQKIFGNFSTVGDAMKSMAAIAATAVITVGGALLAAGKKAADYAIEIEEGSHRTGMAVEDLSRLRYAADMNHLSWEALTLGLSRFASVIDAARDPTSKQAAELHRLGITQAEIEAGSRNYLPVLYKIADAFRDQATGPEKVAIARQLFSIGVAARSAGASFVEMLQAGSPALKQLGVDAERLGLVITEKDIRAAEEFRIATKLLKAELEGMALAIGQAVVPKMAQMVVITGAFVQGLASIRDHLKEVGVAGGLAAAGGALIGSVVPAIGTAAGAAAGAATVGGIAIGAAFAKGVNQGLVEGQERMNRYLATAMASATGPGLAPAKKAAQDFWGLSSILERVQSDLAGVGSEEGRITGKFEETRFQVIKATEEFQRLRAAQKLTPEALSRETEAMSALPEMLVSRLTAAMGELHRKQAAALEEITLDLRQRLLAQAELTWEDREQQANLEIDQLRAKYDKEKRLTTENEAALAALRKATLEKLNRDQWEAYNTMLREQQGYLAEMVTANFTSQEKIRWTYDQDLERFSEVEEGKKKKTAEGAAQIAATEVMFNLNREAAVKRYQTALNTLANSTGWKGVFGNEFAQHLKGNEALLREWSTTADQASMMVRVSFESLRESGQQAFAGLAQGMGQNIAYAIVYKESIGAAMRAALASTLESIAAECIVQAIYSTALGFLRLAQWDIPAATSAFTAAGIFAGVGVAAAIAGRAVAPPKAGASTGTAAASSTGTTETTAAGSTAAGGTQSKGSVTIIVQGSVYGTSGVEELAEILNAAVLDRDVRLIATQVKRGGKVGV